MGWVKDVKHVFSEKNELKMTQNAYFAERDRGKMHFSLVNGPKWAKMGSVGWGGLGRGLGWLRMMFEVGMGGRES